MIVLKYNRAFFVMIISIINAISVYLASILPYYLPPNLTQPTIILISTLANAIVTYLYTEEQNQPEKREFIG